MRADMPPTETEIWDRALHLAELGRGAVSPNPTVGAVLVKDGLVVGEGWHKQRGDLHAERVALADAATCGNDVRGATAYVTLEPCAHTGSQPPCADALIEAGVAEVVIGSPDPTEKTAGVGPRKLQEAGIKVREAGAEDAPRARRLVQDFRKRAATGRPLVILKTAMSLDGKVATRTGDSHWITGPESRELVHKWRAELDAIAVGSGTFKADDPKLTARIDGVERQPMRLVFGTTREMTPDSAIFEDIKTARVGVVVYSDQDLSRADALSDAGAIIFQTQAKTREERFVEVLDQLGHIEVCSILVEGGPTLAGVAIASGEVDRMEVFVAPLVIGGGLSAVEAEGPDLLADAIRVPQMRVARVGQDVLMSADLKDW
ncbi:MAG: bifunctional diaminohydroxyphosphoribosylaminopyrimidine deaminase/5-amino-6-(5-phosphoribosylamino)uracil reductase RibD [Thermoleophilia bacterium]|nr:bifunctional diaminohydroxyphosphoribosylaminopyrimidine deaminase/5-amino-6-(5-phosphoribosylamino)uracil reductase RibD [Thermoleophilia bacterium]